MSNEQRIENEPDSLTGFEIVCAGQSRSCVTSEAGNQKDLIEFEDEDDTFVSVNGNQYKYIETIPATDVEELRCNNAQLREANQRWSREWGKMEAKYSSRVKELEAERDQLDREKTELKLAEDARIREYEKLLMAAEQNRQDEKNAKEEALLQLASADNKIKAQTAQLSLLEENISLLTRQNQALETEIGVVKAQTMKTTRSSHPTSFSDPAEENTVLKQQLILLREDFDEERNDRINAQKYKEHYKREVDKYRKRARDAENELLSAEKKVKSLIERNHKLDEEVESLRKKYAELKSQYSNHRQQQQLQQQQQQQQQRQQQQQQQQHQQKYQMHGVQGTYIMTQNPDRPGVYEQVIHSSRPQQCVVNPQMNDQNRVPHFSPNIAGQHEFHTISGYTHQAQGGVVTTDPLPVTVIASSHEFVPRDGSYTLCTNSNGEFNNLPERNPEPPQYVTQNRVSYSQASPMMFEQRTIPLTESNVPVSDGGSIHTMSTHHVTAPETTVSDMNEGAENYNRSKEGTPEGSDEN